MRKFWAGIFIGLLVGAILATVSYSLAAQPIKLIVNGHEVSCNPPPQMIQDRVFVPVRFVAEALGAKVEWDKPGNAVVINSQNRDSGAIINSKPQTKEATDMPSPGMINIQTDKRLMKDAQRETIFDGEIYISPRLLSESMADAGRSVSIVVPPGQVICDRVTVNYMDVAKIIDGRSYVPLLLFEKAGVLKYSWDNTTKTLTITW